MQAIFTLVFREVRQVTYIWRPFDEKLRVNNNHKGIIFIW